MKKRLRNSTGLINLDEILARAYLSTFGNPTAIATKAAIANKN